MCYKDRLSALSPMSLSKEESTSACVWCCLSVEGGGVSVVAAVCIDRVK